jgi:hypothetical protein
MSLILKQTTEKNDCQICNWSVRYEEECPYVCKECYEYSVLNKDSSVKKLYDYIEHYFWSVSDLKRTLSKIEDIGMNHADPSIYEIKELINDIKNTRMFLTDAMETVRNHQYQAMAELAIYKLSKTISEESNLTRAEVIDIFKIPAHTIQKYNKANKPAGNRSFNYKDIERMIKELADKKYYYH